MEKRELTCISCPLGCNINLELENSQIKSINGYSCPRGKNYAVKEVTNPTRIVTSSVKVIGGEYPVVSVKTRSDIPKNKVWECVKVLKKISVEAPIRAGEIILSNAADTGVDVIATKDVELQNSR